MKGLLLLTVALFVNELFLSVNTNGVDAEPPEPVILIIASVADAEGLCVKSQFLIYPDNAVDVVVKYSIALEPKLTSITVFSIACS